MKKLKPVSIIILLIVVSFACQKGKKTELENNSSKFHIEILDDDALKIIDPKAVIKINASGFSWAEGPLWFDKEKSLLFSDVVNNKIYKLNSNNDTITFLSPSGCFDENFKGQEPGSNGLLFNNQGALIILQHCERQIVKMNASLDNPEPIYTTIVDNYQGKKFNSPNDGFFDDEGNLYFTDPPYGLPEKLDDPNKELPFQGVFCLLTTGELLLVDDELTFPNGIAVSNDGKILYVAVSDPKGAKWYAYDIIAPGKVENKRVFYDVTSYVKKTGNPDLPDGLKVNKNGIIFASGPGGLWIFNPLGIPLARIYTGELTSNCALTTDQKKLFITADNYILSVDLK